MVDSDTQTRGERPHSQHSREGIKYGTVCGKGRVFFRAGAMNPPIQANRHNDTPIPVSRSHPSLVSLLVEMPHLTTVDDGCTRGYQTKERNVNVTCTRTRDIPPSGRILGANPVGKNYR